MNKTNIVRTEPFMMHNVEMTNNFTLKQHFEYILLKYKNITKIDTRRVFMNNYETNRFIDTYCISCGGLYRINGEYLTREECFDYVFNKIWIYESEVICEESN